MLKKLKDILNTYTDEELGYADLWVDCRCKINYIIAQDDNIILVTDEAQLRIDEQIEQFGTKKIEEMKNENN